MIVGRNRHERECGECGGWGAGGLATGDRLHRNHALMSVGAISRTPLYASAQQTRWASATILTGANLRCTRSQTRYERVRKILRALGNDIYAELRDQCQMLLRPSWHLTQHLRHLKARLRPEFESDATDKHPLARSPACAVYIQTKSPTNYQSAYLLASTLISSLLRGAYPLLRWQNARQSWCKGRSLAMWHLPVVVVLVLCSYRDAETGKQFLKSQRNIREGTRNERITRVVHLLAIDGGRRRQRGLMFL